MEVECDKVMIGKEMYRYYIQRPDSPSFFCRIG